MSKDELNDVLHNLTTEPDISQSKQLTQCDRKMGEKGMLNSSALLTIHLLIFISSFSESDCVRYDPTWKSLDARPLPQVRILS